MGRTAHSARMTVSARHKLLDAPPEAVQQTLRQLGADLRLARLQRNLTIDDVARRIGTGERAVADAERGKPSTGVAVYAAMLWAFDRLGPLTTLAAADRDGAGRPAPQRRIRTRAARPRADTRRWRCAKPPRLRNA